MARKVDHHRLTSRITTGSASISPRTEQLMSTSPPISTRTTKSRTSHACDRCRAMRTKCSGGVRCSKCIKDDEECAYGDRKRERNKKDLVESLDRVRELETENNILMTALAQIASDTELVGDRYSDALGILAKHRTSSVDKSPQSTRDQSQYQQSPTNTFDSFETPSELRSQNKTGERYASSSIGSPGKQGELSRVVDLDHGVGAAGFVGKMSEMSWLQRAREYLIKDPIHHHDAAPAEYDQHAAAAQDLAYFMDDWNLLAVDEDHVDHLERPVYQAALVLTEAYFHSCPGSVCFIFRDQFFSLLVRYLQPCSIPSWNERRWLAVANMVWAIGAKWLQLTGLDHNLPGNHLDFYARARALGIDHRVLFDHPDVEMVQGIGLLAFYLLINGSITRARNILGHAVRHATALGLHLKISYTTITQAEQEKRARIWYSLYSLEILIAEITGRPISIQTVQVTIRLEMLERSSSDIDNSQSLELQAESKDLWARFLQGPHAHETETRGLHSTIGSVLGDAQEFSWHVRLCQISDSIAVKLYCGGADLSWADVQDRIETVQGTLADWSDDVGSSIQLNNSQQPRDGQTLPISLAMYYHSLNMILYRACLCEINIADESQRSRDFNLASARACVQAALTMLRLIPDYSSSPQIWQFVPWWALLHYICQALAVLLIELCLDCQHCQKESIELLDAAKKAMEHLRSMSERSLSAYRAWRIFRQLFTLLSTRHGGPGSLGLQDSSIEHPPNWTEFNELALSALLV